MIAMAKSIKWIFVVLFILTIIFFGLAFIPFLPKAERFDTYKDVAASGLIEKGWIPAFLPPDAFNIVHIHDLDTSETVVEFSYQQDLVERIEQGFNIVPLGQLKNVKDDAKKLGWNFRDSSYVKYFQITGKEHRSILAINVEEKRALYWEEVNRPRKR